MDSVLPSCIPRCHVPPDLPHDGFLVATHGMREPGFTFQLSSNIVDRMDRHFDQWCIEAARVNGLRGWFVRVKYLTLDGPAAMIRVNYLSRLYFSWADVDGKVQNVVLEIQIHGFLRGIRHVRERNRHGI